MRKILLILMSLILFACCDYVNTSYEENNIYQQISIEESNNQLLLKINDSKYVVLNDSVDNDKVKKCITKIRRYLFVNSDGKIIDQKDIKSSILSLFTNIDNDNVKNTTMISVFDVYDTDQQNQIVIKIDFNYYLCKPINDLYETDNLFNLSEYLKEGRDNTISTFNLIYI